MPWRSGPARDLSATGIPCSDPTSLRPRDVALAVPTPTDLFLSLLISSIASGYLIYGRRQSSPPALLSGIGLLVLPFVVPSGVALVALALLLMALPFLLGRR